MKFLKRLFLILGAIIVLAAIGLLLYYFWLSSNSLNFIIQFVTNSIGSKFTPGELNATRTGLLLGILGALIGGIVLGIGIAWPRRTFKNRLEDKQAQDAADAKSAADKAAQRNARKLANHAQDQAEQAADAATAAAQAQANLP